MTEPPAPAGGPVVRLARTLRERLRRARRSCPADCGRDDPPPAYAERSYALLPPSPDQERIVAVLPGLVGPATRILHVGVGASDLARLFAPRVARIDGLTVLADELEVARALGLPNYHPRLANKYGATALGGPYDLVIDNNPTSFVCCRRHARELFPRYAAALAPGGRVLTDERGAAWRQPGGLSMDQAGWARAGEAAGLDPERLTATVWALHKR